MKNEQDYETLITSLMEMNRQLELVVLRQSRMLSNCTCRNSMKVSESSTIHCDTSVDGSTCTMNDKDASKPLDYLDDPYSTFRPISTIRPKKHITFDFHSDCS
jgi:hypothetical protein